MKLSKRSKRIFSIIMIATLVVGIVVNYMIFLSLKKGEEDAAKSSGKTIAVKIQSELDRLDNTLLLLEDLYDAQDQEFLDDFHTFCSTMLDDNLAIGSLYFAPGGVIQYSAPEQVETYTDAFNMLEDPIKDLNLN